MRVDTPTFRAANEAPEKEPRFIVSIEFDVERVYLTSHSGISSIPGVVIENVLRDPSAVSQRIVPDEGRSEIGSFDFDVVDVASAFSQAVKDRLDEGEGLRGKTVRLYIGYENPDPVPVDGYGAGPVGSGGYGTTPTYDPVSASFDQFKLFQTQIIKEVSFDEGVYEIRCTDITREQRKDIFEPKKTTLRNSIDADDTTVEVYVTTGFQPVYHGTSYSDGPSSVAGYIKIDKEWIRYTGKTDDSFTGCTRGVLNTKAVPHIVDANAEADRRPKVEEGIYLELPAVKMAYAVMTGIIYGSPYTLPPHWHLGIDPDLVTLADFTQIGQDLWDTTDDTAGFVARFTDLKKTDGKRFLESEIYQLIGCYSPVYSDGTLGLRRMNQVLADAAYSVELSPSNCVSWSSLKHAYQSLHNIFRIDWNWNGEEFTRTTLFQDSVSIATHGEAPIKNIRFKGLHGSRHTDGIIRKRIDALRDRYSYPPEEISVTVMPSLNRLEVGDIVRANLPNVRDFAGTQIPLNRSFEIQRKSENHVTGEVTLELFGSTGEAIDPNAPTTGVALSDSYYTSTGTELSTVVTISTVGGVGVIQAGTYQLTGHADLNNASAIYYYNGDLELADGATLEVHNNVQLRVKGFFTVNGDIDGIGNGHSGVADGSADVDTLGTSGFIGHSRGMDGVIGNLSVNLSKVRFTSKAVPTTFGLHSAFPYLELSVSAGSLIGLPSDLMGTSGGPGGKLIRTGNDPNQALGGTGANSGAGLAIICRGLAFGASSLIDLSGSSSSSTTLQSFIVGYVGAGGAGSPGGLFIGLDGSTLSVPDIGGHFVAATGSVPVNGNPMSSRGPLKLGQVEDPIAGYLDPAMISAVDLSNVAYRIQYLPAAETAHADQIVQPPTDLASLSALNSVMLSWRTYSAGPIRRELPVTEIYASLDNNRANATQVGEVVGNSFTHTQQVPATYYYWVRNRNAAGDDVSDYYPTSSTSGTRGSALPTSISGALIESHDTFVVGPVILSNVA